MAGTASAGQASPSPPALPKTAISLDQVTFVVYGDSIVDNGNTVTFTNGAWPEPPYAGPFSNGPSFIGYLSDLLGVAADDRAFGGATVDSRVLAGFTGPTEDWPVLGLTQQWQMRHKALGESNASTEIAFLCPSGNDYYFKMITAPWALLYLPAIADTVVGSIVALAEEIAAASPSMLGIAVCDNYPAQLVPFVTSSSFFSVLYQRIHSLHNSKLAARLAQAQLNGVPLIKVPLTAATEGAVRNVSNALDACLVDGIVCSDPDSYAFWDTFHPTTALHELIAHNVKGSILEQLPAHVQ